MIVSTTFGKQPQQRPRCFRRWYTFAGTMSCHGSSSRRATIVSSISLAVMRLQWQTSICLLMAEPRNGAAGLNTLSAVRQEPERRRPGYKLPQAELHQLRHLLTSRRQREEGGRPRLSKPALQGRAKAELRCGAAAPLRDPSLLPPINRVQGPDIKGLRRLTRRHKSPAARRCQSKADENTHRSIT